MKTRLLLTMATRAKVVDEHLKKFDLGMDDLGISFKSVNSKLENKLTATRESF